MNKLTRPFSYILAFLAMAFSTQATMAAVGFTGAFAPENWQITESHADFGGDVYFTGTTTLTIEGPDGEEGCDDSYQMSASIVIPQTGLVQFDWEFVNLDEDPDYDFFIVRKTDNGDQDLIFTTETSSGHFAELFQAGDVLAIIVASEDCVLGPGIATITNFEFGGPPSAVPLSAVAVGVTMLLIFGLVVVRANKRILYF